METEAITTTLLPVDEPRTITLSLGEKTYRLGFCALTLSDWRRYLEAVTLSVEQKGDTRTTVQTEEPALAALVAATLRTVDGTPFNKSISPRLAIAAGTTLRMAAATTSEDSVLSALVEVEVEALWSADAEGNMTMYKGLVHRLTQPTIDQLRRYKMGVARVATTGTSTDGVTKYASRAAVALGLYDELIVEVDGYSVDGDPLTTDVEAIRKYMDCYHKAIVALEVFEPSEQVVTIGKPETTTDEAAAA